MNSGISIIVCCYNSSQRIEPTLQHIANQQIDSKYIECILVDNNSTDHTTERANEIWQSLGTPFSLKIFSEPQQGLIHARIKGIQESTHKYIIFCDDDNWLNNNYAHIAIELFDKNPNIAAIGGESVLANPESAPDWFADHQLGYAIGSQRKIDGNANSGHYLWGAGLCVRKDVILRTFITPYTLTGRTGNQLGSGEDVEMCARILLMGYSLYYDSRLKLKHDIDVNRLTWNYMKILFEGHTISNRIFQTYQLAIDIYIQSFRHNAFIFFYYLIKSLATYLFDLKSPNSIHPRTMLSDFMSFLIGTPLKNCSAAARSILFFSKKLSETSCKCH